MLRPALIDTDLLAALMHGEARLHARAYLANHKRLTISVVTLQELASGYARRERASDLLDTLTKDPERCEVLGIDGPIAQLAGSLDGAAKARGLGVGVLDSLIAATAIVHGRVLVSAGRFEALQAAATAHGRPLTVVDWRR